MSTARVANRVGLVCLIVALALWASAWPLHCAWLAAQVGVVDLLAGALMGLFLALITRTRRAPLIYLYLGLAGLACWPLIALWPVADAQDVQLWRGAPDILLYYFTVFRPCVFLLGLPFPFARFGQHGPDLLPAPSSGQGMVPSPVPSSLQSNTPSNASTDVPSVSRDNTIAVRSDAAIQINRLPDEVECRTLPERFAQIEETET